MAVKSYLPYLSLLLLAALLGWMLLFWHPADRQESGLFDTDMARVPEGGGFRLESWRGPVSLEDFRGSVVLIYFGYTWCPDVCPTNLGYIGLALDSLSPAQQERVQVLFISVDPERDSLERLHQYTEFFHPRVMGLSGDSQTLTRVAAQYGVYFRRANAEDGADGYQMDHSSFTYLVGTDGRLRRSLGHATSPRGIAAALRTELESAGGS